MANKTLKEKGNLLDYVRSLPRTGSWQPRLKGFLKRGAWFVWVDCEGLTSTMALSLVAEGCFAGVGKGFPCPPGSP